MHQFLATARRRALVVGFLCLAFSGCAVQQLQCDHDRIRTALLDLYTNQIIDNLIRLHNGLPIIHLDYTNATAVVTVVDTESLSDSVATTATTVTTHGLTPTLTNSSTSNTTTTKSATPSTVAAVTAAFTSVLASAFSVVSTRGVLNTVTAGGTHANSNQVALTANPVINSNDVYDAYLQFLTIPGSLQATPEPPEDGMAIICRRAGGLYYWIPSEFKKDFVALSLHTTAQRGMPVLEQQSIQVTLTQVVPNVDGQPFKRIRDDVYEFTVLLNGPQGPGSRVFNDDGVMALDGKTINFAKFVPKDSEGKKWAKPPFTTDRLLITVDFRTKAQIDAETPKEKKDQPGKAPDAKDGTARPNAPLKATTAKEFMNIINVTRPPAALTYLSPRPSVSSTEQLLNHINFNTQQTNMNLLRIRP